MSFWDPVDKGGLGGWFAKYSIHSVLSIYFLGSFGELERERI